MKNKLYLFVFLLQVLALSVHAARVDTVFVKKSFDEQGGKGGLYSSG